MTPERRPRRATGALLAGLLLAGGLAGSAVASEDDLFVIRCATFTDSDHATLAKRAGAMLGQVRELKANLVRVEHSQKSSTVYYGRYQRGTELFSRQERFRPDPMPDLRLIRELSLMSQDSFGREIPVWPFRGATIEPLRTASTNPSEWDLSNAKGFWTWQVAVFYNEGEFRERRAAAEEYCKELRGKGEEAYFHHGPVRSSVTIGLFPREALQVTEERHPLTGTKGVKARPVDPRMAELEKRYPMNLENGRPMYTIVRSKDGSVQERLPNPSFAVRVPGS